MERHLIEEPRGRARARGKEMDTAAPLIPPRPTISKLQEAARGCRACPLWKLGTQTVFGEGARKAKVIFVGEQPGNDEDLAGKPFVGPAGKLLDKALVEAGIKRDEVYVTNAVKHFKWEPRGKRRIHKCAREGRMPSLARRGDRPAQARSHRLPRRHRRAVAVEQRFQGEPVPRRTRAITRSRRTSRPPSTRPRSSARRTRKRVDLITSASSGPQEHRKGDSRVGIERI